MPGERDLSALLKGMKPELQPDIFVFCSLPRGCEIPANVHPLLVFHEQEGIALIVRQEEAEQAGLSYEFPSHLITLTVHSALDAVGFLAVIVSRLADAGIAVNAVSAFHHDHLFVRKERAEEALRLLLLLCDRL